MTAFKLDTSGSVRRPQANVDSAGRANWLWSDLTPFAQGYVEALFAHSAAPAPLAALGLGFSDVAPATLSRIIDDCERFRGIDRGVYSSDWLLSGGALWAMRQSKTGLPDFPALTLYLAEDGLIYLREAGQ